MASKVDHYIYIYISSTQSTERLYPWDNGDKATTYIYAKLLKHVLFGLINVWTCNHNYIQHYSLWFPLWFDLRFSKMISGKWPTRLARINSSREARFSNTITIFNILYIPFKSDDKLYICTNILLWSRAPATMCIFDSEDGDYIVKSRLMRGWLTQIARPRL